MNVDNENNLNNLLVHRYQNGENEALELLIKRFHPVMLRTICHYTCNREPVDDIAQDCWYTIIKKLSELDLQISFDAWALTIAKRKAIDWIRERQQMRSRNQKVKAESLNRSDNDAGTTEVEADQLDKVRIGIQQLPPTQKMVITMFYLENLSIKEISSVLEISKGTVKSRLFHAREKLKRIIKT